MVNLPGYIKNLKEPPAHSESMHRQQVRSKVTSFVKGLKFSNLVNTGMSPEEAARRIGIDIKFGKILNVNEISKIRETGHLPNE